MEIRSKIEEAGKLFDRVIHQYRPYVKIALVSGGDDSMTLIEVLRMVGSVDYVVHVYIPKGNRIIMYFTGARKDESIRRMGTVEQVGKYGNQVWVNLIHNFTKSDIYHIQKQNNLVRNPASVLLSRSGECNDGAFGDEAELRLMNLFFPKDKSVRMLNRVQDQLIKRNHKFCKYGHGLSNRAVGSEKPKNQILCSTCINNQSAQ